MQFLTNQSKTNPNANTTHTPHPPNQKKKNWTCGRVVPIFVGLASETQKLKPKRKANNHEEIIINSQRSIGHSDLIWAQ